MFEQRREEQPTVLEAVIEALEIANVLAGHLHLPSLAPSDPLQHASISENDWGDLFRQEALKDAAYLSRLAAGTESASVASPVSMPGEKITMEMFKEMISPGGVAQIGSPTSAAYDALAMESLSSVSLPAIPSATETVAATNTTSVAPVPAETQVSIAA